MTDYVDLAVKYGGYTSLDRVYLTNLLSTIPEELRLRDYTPPSAWSTAISLSSIKRRAPKERELFLTWAKYLTYPQFKQSTNEILYPPQLSAEAAQWKRTKTRCA